MARTLVRILRHLVLSTKAPAIFLEPEAESELHRVSRRRQQTPLAVFGDQRTHRPRAFIAGGAYLFLRRDGVEYDERYIWT
jgi:hypothetical protein